MSELQVDSDFYAEHLAEVNDTSKVMLHEDIFNQNGVLVAKKNTIVTRRVAEVIAKHKLVQPLENVIAIDPDSDEVLNVELIIPHLDRLKLTEMLKKKGLYELALSYFVRAFDYQLILQKLTVLSIRLNKEFDRTLFCATFSLGLATELKLEERHIFQIFVASLLSKVGFLHLPPDLVAKTGEYSAEEWRMMQGHVAIAKHFASLIPDFPKEVGRIVLEHRERADGFGYPFSKTQEQLCLGGQVVAMSDKVNGLYNKWVLNGACSWKSLSAIVQLSASGNFEVVRNATLRLLKEINLPIENHYKIEQFSPLISELKLTHIKLNKWFKVLSEILSLHHKELSEEGDFKPYSLLTQLNHTIVSSGLLNEVQLLWLSEVSIPPSDQDRAEIEEYQLKLGEIDYQCSFVMKKLLSQQEEMGRRFNSLELAKHYYKELTDILKPVA